MELPSGSTYKVLVPAGDVDPVVNAMRQSGQLNVHLLDVVERFSEQGGRFVDLGAHVGSVALAAACMGRHVLAVDAARSFVDLMNESARINSFKDFAAVFGAVGDHNGSVRFNVDGPFGQVTTEATGTTVPLYTGSALLRDRGWEHIDVLKVDVEGSEPEVFNGMSQLLSGELAPVIVYESNGPVLEARGVPVEDVRLQLMAFGYTVYSVESGRYAPVPAEQCQVEGVVDLVALKDTHLGAVQHLLREPLTDEELANRAIEWTGLGAPIERLRLLSVLTDPALSFKNDHRVVEAMTRLADDSDEAVRQSAVRALSSRN